MIEKASLRAVVHGRVQGVFFRAFVVSKATELELMGYVRNLPGGAVEVRAEGGRRQLEELIEHLKTGPPHAMVEKVTSEWSEHIGEYPDFRVSY